jgi:WD40 repeat protein
MSANGEPEAAPADGDAEHHHHQQQLLPSTSYPTEGGPLRLAATCRGHRKAVSRVRFSPAGQLLASVSADATLQLWHVPDGTAVLQQQQEQQQQASKGGSGGGTGAPPADATAGASDQQQPQQPQQSDAPQQQQQAAALVMRHAAGVNDVDWNPSGDYLATASDDLSAKIWNAETGACLSTLQGHTNYVFCGQFNPAGNILVSE